MTEETNLTVGGFQYPDGCTAQICEQAAQEIRDLNYTRVRLTIALRIEMGKRLNDVAARLPYGRLAPWLKHQFPDWSRSSIDRWRRIAHELTKEDYDNSVQIEQSLHKFESVTAAEEFVTLPESVREMVIEREAWTRPRFQAVCWQAAMTERLEDGALGEAERYGHVRNAIDEVLHDDESPPPLRQVAEELYQEHRDTFARLEGEDPAVVDVEVGIQWKEPDSSRPSAQLIENDGGYWLCRKVGDEYIPVASVSSYVLMWNGASEPSVLAAFPRTADGPAAVSWQRAGMTALCARLNASTLESRYGEAL